MNVSDNKSVLQRVWIAAEEDTSVRAATPAPEPHAGARGGDTPPPATAELVGHREDRATRHPLDT